MQNFDRAEGVGDHMPVTQGVDSGSGSVIGTDTAGDEAAATSLAQSVRLEGARDD